MPIMLNGEKFIDQKAYKFHFFRIYLKKAFFNNGATETQSKKEIAMSKPTNAPSTTGNPSGGGRGNNPPRSK